MNLIKNKSVLGFILLLISVPAALAQVTTAGTVYFQNAYQVNPAMAGKTADLLTLAGGYRRQLTGVNQSGEIYYATADYGLSQQMGVGLNFYGAKTGLISTTRVMASYAYHLALTQTQRLAFGMSAGIVNQSINTSEIVGDQGDPQVLAFNNQGIKPDLDLGVTYVWNGLTVQVAGAHLLGYMQEDNQVSYTYLRKPSVFSSLSYRVQLIQGVYAPIYITPQICYRQVDGYDGIVDVGARLDFFEELINVFAMYHSTESVTLGLGLKTGEFSLSGMFITPSKDYDDNQIGTEFEVSFQVFLNKRSD